MEELEKKVKQYVKEIDQILNEIEETKRGRNKQIGRASCRERV